MNVTDLFQNLSLAETTTDKEKTKKRKEAIDSIGNFLHDKTSLCYVELVNGIFRNCEDNTVLAQVINHRDEEGTNAVGKAFMARNAYPSAITFPMLFEIAILFAKEKDYHINSNLNNLDSERKHPLYGTTLLHNVIMCAAQMKPTEENKKMFGIIF
jgi:hypothetical protein